MGWWITDQNEHLSGIQTCISNHFLISSDILKHSVIPTLLTDLELSTTTLGIIVHIHVVVVVDKTVCIFHLVFSTCVLKRQN